MTWPPKLETERPSSASSWRLTLPRMIAPALLRAVTTGASIFGWEYARSRQPPVVGMSKVS